MEELASRIPGPAGLPILGNALEFMGTSHIIFSNLVKKSDNFGRTIKLWIGHKLLVFLMDPDDVEFILSSHEHIDKT
ncbi:cytochrome P450, partial [Clostridium perfringens]|nr:cytochrome P450 [Clostridium perfringens]